MAANPKLTGAMPARAPSAEPDLAGGIGRAPARSPARGPAVGPVPSTKTERSIGARTPLCFVIDTDASIRHFLSLILQGSGIDTEEFADGYTLRDALVRRMPDVVFLDIGLEVAGATECIGTLGTSSYRGQVQLTSTRGLGVLAQVKSIGEQQHLHMLPVLSKPFETSVIMKVLQDLRLGQRPALAGRVDLGEALAKGWIEFWYQPKIDLRKKQLVGVEAFARASSGPRRADAGSIRPGRIRREPGRFVRARFDRSHEGEPQLRQARGQFANGGQQCPSTH